MSTNTLLAVIFTVGCLLLYLLKYAYIKAKLNYKIDNPKDIQDDVNLDNGLLMNSSLTFLIFISTLIYDGCNSNYEKELRIKYENVDKFLKEEEVKLKKEIYKELLDISKSKVQTNN